MQTATCGAVLAGWLVACSPAVVSPPPVGVGVAKEPAGTCHPDLPAPCASAPPSFAGEVQPILEKRCFRCHTGDGPAADEHDFSKIDRVLGERSAIREQVASCGMPPRSPLADAEASTLLRWATCVQSVR
jgi:hypothetical protein